MVKRKIFISEEAFNILKKEKQKLVKLRKKYPKRYKHKRYDNGYIFDKILGIK